MTLATLAPSLALLTGIYDKYIEKNGIHSHSALISVDSVAHNSMFLLSHLTNHGMAYVQNCQFM